MIHKRDSTDNPHKMEKGSKQASLSLNSILSVQTHNNVTEAPLAALARAHLQPRRGDAVVGVVRGHVLGADEPVQETDHLHEALLEAVQGKGRRKAEETIVK